MIQQCIIFSSNCLQFIQRRFMSWVKVHNNEKILQNLQIKNIFLKVLNIMNSNKKSIFPVFVGSVHAAVCYLPAWRTKKTQVKAAPISGIERNTSQGDAEGEKVQCGSLMLCSSSPPVQEQWFWKDWTARQQQESGSRNIISKDDSGWKVTVCLNDILLSFVSRTWAIILVTEWTDERQQSMR